MEPTNAAAESLPQGGRGSDRILGAVGGNPVEAERLELLQWLFFVHVACELLLAAPWNALGQRVLAAEAGAFTGVWLALGVIAGLVWRRFGERPAAARLVAWSFCVGALLWLVPNLPNHLFLVVFSLSILVLLNLEDEQERTLGLQGLRWVAIIVFMATGFQKLRYGTYFNGEFMTWAIAHTERFSALFELVMPAEELARIKALPHTGPFGTSWWFLVWVSNGVWLFEILAPLLLFIPRFRGPATAAIIVFLFLIEVGAREWMFGCIFVSLMLLFPKRDYLRRAAPIYALIYLSIFASRIPPQFGYGDWGFLPL